MRDTHRISFHRATAPITRPVSKFGGQPYGLAGKNWPCSRSTGNPMRFICQIALGDIGLSPGQLAYVFITDEEEFVDGTFESDGGENAVVIQAPDAEHAQGPTLYRTVPAGSRMRGDPGTEPCEYAISLTVGSDPEPADPDADDEGRAEPDVSVCKLRGTAVWLQSDETPAGYDLLLQLDSASVPFQINFGDAGVGYVFISPDRKTGKFLWQCC